MAPTPPVIGAVTRVTVIKRMPYRASTDEEFSNTYELKDPPPQTPQEWSALTDSLIAHEEPIYPAFVHFLRVYGYNTSDPKAHHVYAHDYEQAGQIHTGTYVPSANENVGAGDQASVVEWRTDQVGQKGKPIILKKFHHTPYINAAGSSDELGTQYKAQLDIYASSMQGVWGGPFTINHPGNIISASALPYVTTRTLKRRGKRPVPKA